MGYGATNRRKVIMFHEFLTGGSNIGTNTNDPSKTSRTMSYLNVQSDGLRQDVNKHLHADKSEGGGDIDQLSAPVYYSPPLHSLFSDIALPNMLQPIESDLSNVNIWMNSHSSVNPESSITGSVLNFASNLFSPSSEKSIDRMTSRMHMDATDNLYVLLQGDKTFNLVDPSQAMLMETIMPTYAVAANGLSFRYNPVKYPIFETGTVQILVDVCYDCHENYMCMVSVKMSDFIDPRITCHGL